MITAADVAAFLSTHAGIAKVNFKFDGFPVYPTGYSKDLADLLTTGRITVIETSSLPSSVGARWMNQGNTLYVRTGTAMSDPADQSYVLHEMTHAHVDYHRGGNSFFSAWWGVDQGEAVGYLAEAVFREGQGLAPMDSTALRAEAHRVAKTVLGGAYEVGATDVEALKKAVLATPHYAAKSGWQIADGIE
jgi:hypothetical protein